MRAVVANIVPIDLIKSPRIACRLLSVLFLRFTGRANVLPFFGVHGKVSHLGCGQTYSCQSSKFC